MTHNTNLLNPAVSSKEIQHRLELDQLWLYMFLQSYAKIHNVQYSFKWITQNLNPPVPNYLNIRATVDGPGMYHPALGNWWPYFTCY